MLTTHSPSSREAGPAVKAVPPARRAAESSATHAVDPTVWQRILQNVRLHHPSLNRVWFDQMTPRQLTNGVIQVTVATPAQLNFCQSQCQQPFTHAAQSITGRLVAVSFHCENIPRGGVFNEGDQPLPLNPDYVFENFVTGPCNRLPHAASVAVGENPGKAYNPLFIHGGVGLGKTHLLQAVCQTILQREPGARICYLSCDAFMNHFLDAVQSGQMSDFRHRYRDVDLLLIDDIHFLTDKKLIQEEFFHTFNELYQHKKQIVLSSDSPPNEIPQLEERLVSRFNCGLVTRVDKACYETRVAIVKKKAALRGMAMPDDVACYIAASIDTNTRELEGAITRVQSVAMLRQIPIELDLARQALGDDAQAATAPQLTIQNIIDAVTQFYGVKLADLQSKRRHRSITMPRQVCMYLARKRTRYSLEEIGGYFGGRDHTTVMHALRAVQDRIDTEIAFRGEVEQIDRTLTSKAA